MNFPSLSLLAAASLLASCSTGSRQEPEACKGQRGVTSNTLSTTQDLCRFVGMAVPKIDPNSRLVSSGSVGGRVESSDPNASSSDLCYAAPTPKPVSPNSSFFSYDK